MDAEPPLDYLLDGSTGGTDPAPNGPAPGREELQAIVARSQRHMLRAVSIAMAVTLAVGGVGGWIAAVAARGSTRTTTIAAGTPPANPVAGTPELASGSGGFGISSGVSSASAATVTPFTKLFVRTTADGVAIRDYQLPGVPNPVASGPGCPILVPPIEAEVSTASIATQAIGFMIPTTVAPFKALATETVGVEEGAPVWVVTTETSAGVAQVRATFADGTTDQMAPVDGWATLAHLAPASKAVTAISGSVEALDAGGKPIATVPFPSRNTLGGPQIAFAGGVAVPPTATILPAKVPPAQPTKPLTPPATLPPTTVPACVAMATAQKAARASAASGPTTFVPPESPGFPMTTLPAASLATTTTVGK